MTLLCSINVLCLRWRPPTIWAHERDLALFRGILQRDLAQHRLGHLRNLCRTCCPSRHIDRYIFVLAIASVMCSAIFSLVARSADISMWYPLALLLVPAVLGIYSTRLRSTMASRRRQFKHVLQQALQDFSKLDSLNGIQWTFRSPRAADKVPRCHAGAQLCWIIEVHAMDLEEGVYPEDPLPTYQQATITSMTTAFSATAIASATTTLNSTTSFPRCAFPTPAPPSYDTNHPGMVTRPAPALHRSS